MDEIAGNLPRRVTSDDLVTFQGCFADGENIYRCKYVVLSVGSTKRMGCRRCDSCIT